MSRRCVGPRSQNALRHVWKCDTVGSARMHREFFFTFSPDLSRQRTRQRTRQPQHAANLGNINGLGALTFEPDGLALCSEATRWSNQSSMREPVQSPSRCLRPHPGSPIDHVTTEPGCAIADWETLSVPMLFQGRTGTAPGEGSAERAWANCSRVRE